MPRHRLVRPHTPTSAAAAFVVVGVLTTAVAIGLFPANCGDSGLDTPRSAPGVPQLRQRQPGHVREGKHGATRPTRQDEAARWREVLSRLDRLRGQAWRLGEPRLLRRVYTPESAALHRDQDMLRSYQRRGLRVEGVRHAWAALAVARGAPDGIRVTAVDRLRPMAARGPTGRQRLPRDRPTRHDVVLRRADGEWRIAAVS